MCPNLTPKCAHHGRKCWSGSTRAMNWPCWESLGPDESVAEVSHHEYLWRLSPPEELQLAYIAFLLGQNADGFDQPGPQFAAVAAHRRAPQITGEKRPRIRNKFAGSECSPFSSRLHSAVSSRCCVFAFVYFLAFSEVACFVAAAVQLRGGCSSTI